jgi:hypothetical protein
MDTAESQQPKAQVRGPWTIRYGNVSDADEGFGIVSELDPGFGIVAECWPCSTDLEKRRQLRANARLIAAAPDLFEACRKAVTCASLPDGVRKFCLEAIGKAIGVKV